MFMYLCTGKPPHGSRNQIASRLPDKCALERCGRMMMTMTMTTTMIMMMEMQMVLVMVLMMMVLEGPTRFFPRPALQ